MRDSHKKPDHKSVPHSAHRGVQLALIQMPISPVPATNIERASQLIQEAAEKGAQIVLLPELFEHHYFCQVEREEYFSLARPLAGNTTIAIMQELARKHQLVLPVSFFESAGQAYFNSLAMIDADGTLLGCYRKSHIPDGPGYEEKYYFNPGDTGFKTWQTAYGKIGVGICWDQWFPECARSMALQGADLLLYPTAIGSEPSDQVKSPNTYLMWQRAMCGHAVSNACYVAAANRIGVETFDEGSRTCTFYGHSFISDYCGEIVAEAQPTETKILSWELDFVAAREFRAGMGFFRDRRPELYKNLLSLDGGVPQR